MCERHGYPVVEIFESLQGEGYNTGLESVFLRFGGCNLKCPWCDTRHETFETLDEETVVARVTACSARAVILTGGEPFLQTGLEGLLTRFRDAGFWIGAETNGVLAPSAEVLRRMDYLTVSPKALYAPLYDDARMVRRADEVRIVVDGEVRDFCMAMRNRIEAPRYYLSPCERDGTFNIGETVRLLGELNRGRRSGKWRLSLQTHKLAGFR